MSCYFGINSTLFVQFSNDLIKQQYFYGTIIFVPLGIYYLLIYNLKINNSLYFSYKKKASF